ncbi:MAG: N-acetylmuramoyl-L-alanine amidase [Eubacteriales bacterium]
MAVKIFVDQGHNPRNPNSGAEGNGLNEQDLTYKIGVLLAQLLEEDPRFEVKLSRNSPTEQLGTSNATSLAARVNAANEWGADYFISLHANASDIPTASGSEALVYSAPSTASALGEDILAGLNAETGIPNRGISLRPGLYVLRKTQMPAVLVEMGFISNAAEAALMDTEPQLFAAGIYNGIVDYIGG